VATGPAPHGWRSGRKRKNRDSRRDGADNQHQEVEMEYLLIIAAIVLPLIVARCIGDMGLEDEADHDVWRALGGGDEHE